MPDSFYIYSQARPGEAESQELMMLRGSAESYDAAVAAADAIYSGRPAASLSEDKADVPGVITGLPVWVRNKPGRPVVMVTQHTSPQAAVIARAVVQLHLVVDSALRTSEGETLRHAS